MKAVGVGQQAYDTTKKLDLDTVIQTLNNKLLLISAEAEGYTEADVQMKANWKEADILHSWLHCGST